MSEISKMIDALKVHVEGREAAIKDLEERLQKAIEVIKLQNETLKLIKKLFTNPDDPQTIEEIRAFLDKEAPK